MTMRKKEMKKFEVHNKNSGVCLGIYSADTPQEAIEAMYRDAGYASEEDARAVAHAVQCVATEVAQDLEEIMAALVRDEKKNEENY